MEAMANVIFILKLYFTKDIFFYISPVVKKEYGIIYL